MSDAVLIVAGVSCTIISLLAIILVSLSFQYVEYDQYGLKKDTTTSKVDYGGIYDTGRYAWGPSYTTLGFPKLFQTVDFTHDDSLNVFTNTGVNLSLEVSFQYRLQKEHLIDIFQSYGTDYATQVENVGRAAIKNAAVDFEVTDYFLNRENISNAMLIALQKELTKVWAVVPLHKFQLRKVTFPFVVTNRFLTAAVIAQETLEKKAQAIADVYRAETDLQVLQVTAKADIIKSQATATIAQLQSEANAKAYGIRTSAEGYGVEYLCEALKLTDSLDKMNFLTLYRLAQSSGSRALFGLMQNDLLVRA